MPTAHNGSPRTAGIRDVARMAGVSVASASFALNGQPGVADDTRRRILAIAEQLGYRANPQAQALRRGRTTTYGFVVRNFANPFFLEVLSGAEEVAGEAGATLLVLDSRYSLERERRHLQEMAAQRLAGLAIAPVGTGASIRLWHELSPGAPVVALNASASRITGVCRVRPDNAAAVELPLRRARRAGPHLGRVPDRAAPADGGPRPAAPLPAAEPGARAAGHRAVLAADPGRRAAGCPGRAGRPGWPARAPTAVITNSDYTAHAVYKAARGAGAAHRPRGLRRRARRPGHLRAPGPAAGDHLAEPAGNGPGADGCACWGGSRRTITWPPWNSSSGLPCRRRPAAAGAPRGPSGRALRDLACGPSAPRPPGRFAVR